MPQDNGKIQLTWELALWLMALPLRATSLKLLISMLHQQELRDGWPAYDDRPQPCWATLTALRARVGPRGSNDARAFRRLRDDLLEKQIATHCDFCRHRRGLALRWVFAPAVAAEMSWRSRKAYVLLDLLDLGRLKTRDEMRLYINLRREWNKDAPAIDLALSSESWPADLKRYERALPRLANLFGATFHLSLIYRTDAPVPDRLTVKIEHAGTNWYDGALEKAPPDACRWTICPAGAE